MTAYGPWEAQASPDGKRIAYWRGIQRLDAPIGGHTPYDLEDQVVVSRSDRFTPDSAFGYQRDYPDPSWVDNRELLVFNYGLGLEEAASFARGDRSRLGPALAPATGRPGRGPCRPGRARRRRPGDGDPPASAGTAR